MRTTLPIVALALLVAACAPASAPGAGSAPGASAEAPAPAVDQSRTLVIAVGRAPDDRTVTITWRQPFADADDLQVHDLSPLPRHLLASAYAQQSADAFVANPYWVTEYIGLGPYRATRFDLGTSLEGEAFA